MATINCGIWLPLDGEFSDQVALASLAATAEECQWDGMFLWDHTWLHPHGEQYSTSPNNALLPDVWMALAAIAQTTRRIVIGPMVSPIPRYLPWELAQRVWTLVSLLSSGDRMILGVGLGQTSELLPLTVRDKSLGEDREIAFGDGLAFLRALLLGEQVVGFGPTFRIDGVDYGPKLPSSVDVRIWTSGRISTSKTGDPIVVFDFDRADGVFPIPVPWHTGSSLAASEVAAAKAHLNTMQPTPSLTLAISGSTWTANAPVSTTVKN